MHIFILDHILSTYTCSSNNFFSTFSKKIIMKQCRYFNGSVLYPFVVARSTVQRWIPKSRPPIPENFEQYYDSLMSDIWRERYTQRDKATLTVRNVVAADNSRIILYTDIGLVQALPVIEKIAVDATFKVCPKRPQMRQFLTIMTHLIMWLVYNLLLLRLLIL